MHIAIRTSILALAATALAAPAAGAATPEKGTFSLAIEGRQTTTARYVKPMEPSCDYPETGQSSQTITFKAARKVKLAITRSGVVRVAPGTIPLTAAAGLRGDSQRLYSQQTACGPGGLAVGERAPDDRSTSTCETTGSMLLRLSWPARGTLAATADPQWSLPPSDTSLPARCSAIGRYNADSLITRGAGEWAGGLVPTTAKVSGRTARKLFSGKGTKVALSRTIRYPAKAFPNAGLPGTSGQTVSLVTLKLRRLKG